MPDSAAHGLRGHPGPSLLFRKLPRELTVGHSLPVGNLQQQCPHRLLKCRASRVQRRQKARLPPRKVKVKLLALEQADMTRFFVPKTGTALL